MYELILESMSRALIIEDNANFRQTLKGLLASRFSFMDLDEAQNGKQAFEKISSSVPDLIFMDIKLQAESGLELTKKIKAAYPDIIIVILTSYDLPEYRDAAEKYGANHFLTKGSSSAEDILVIVETILSNHGLMNECEP